MLAIRQVVTASTTPRRAATACCHLVPLRNSSPTGRAGAPLHKPLPQEHTSHCHQSKMPYRYFSDWTSRSASSAPLKDPVLASDSPWFQLKSSSLYLQHARKHARTHTHAQARTRTQAHTNTKAQVVRDGRQGQVSKASYASASPPPLAG